MWKFKQNTTKPGSPIWDEYVEIDESGAETGRSTLSTFTPNKITDFDTCNHYFEYIDNGNNAICKKCELGQRLILGLHKIEDGKIITTRKL